MEIRKSLLVAILLIIYKISFSQVIYDYGFEKKYNITVTDSLGSILQMPWVGGMNSMQFSKIDLNLDGIPDMLAFDKAGNKILTFINHGITDSVDYVYDYRYQNYFPNFNGWVHLLDYNNDNKNDIFTYTSAGIKVYKNISDTVLKFQLLYSIINSNMGSSISNIAITPDDYPAFYDFDDDGDIDILAFFGLGAYLQLHKNLSQELYGNSDTLVYKLQTECWGDISESATNSHINLNISCPWRTDNFGFMKESRHTGSTMLAGDFNGDNLTDLILGDVDYFNLAKLTNGGTMDSAHIISADTLFPNLIHPISFNSFPVASMIDVNNDGLKDLIASPFASNIYISENLNSVWYYKNTGDSLIPNFSFVKPGFLQDKMLDFGSGAYPVIYDVNSDGLPDIMVGNYGYLDSSYYEFGYLKSNMRSQIAVLQNTGTSTNPSFHLLTRDYAGLSQLKLQGLTPTFGDMDNDGDIDMICGQSNGTLIYFENTAGAGNLPVYNPPVYNYKGIDVGDFSAPQIFDLNSDNLPDLVIGKKDGFISYYRNTGSLSNPAFTKVTDSLGKVCVFDPNVSYFGYSTPCFFKDSNRIKLFVGSNSGYIFYYKDIEANLSGKFTAIDSMLIYIEPDSSTYLIKDGIQTGVSVADLNNDGHKDMILGNFSGGLTYYNGVKVKTAVGITEYNIIQPVDFSIYPNPVSEKLNIKMANGNYSQCKIEIYDLVGRKVTEKEFRNTTTISLDMHNLQSGFYTCHLLTINKDQNWLSAGIRKFIISH